LRLAFSALCFFSLSPPQLCRQPLPEDVFLGCPAFDPISFIFLFFSHVRYIIPFPLPCALPRFPSGLADIFESMSGDLFTSLGLRLLNPPCLFFCTCFLFFVLGPARHWQCSGSVLPSTIPAPVFYASSGRKPAFPDAGLHFPPFF